MEKMKNFMINCIIFLFVFVGAIILGWTVVEEDVMRYLTQTEIVPEEFEANFEYALENAVFDNDSISAIGWMGLVPYIGEEVPPIGEIMVPTVDIRLPILHGATNINMSLGAGTLDPDDRMGEGNFALASHWMPTPGLLFASLYQVEIGDPIILRDANYLYIYEIFEHKTVYPYRGDVLLEIEDKVVVTLVTCTPDMIQRVIIQGELVEQVPIEDFLAGLVELDEDFIGLEEITEILEPAVIEFPFVQVALVILGALFLASLVVFISNTRSRRRKRQAKAEAK